MKRPVGFMPVKSFERALNQIPRSQRILRLHHFGESPLNPDFPVFIKMTRSAGMIPVVSLNPSSITEKLIDSIIDSGVGIVCFSLDSLNSHRLNLIRGITKSAEYCLEMIRSFIDKSRGSSEPVLKIIQMVSLTINIDERHSFLSLKEKYPEDDVYIYISNNYGFGNPDLIKETDEYAAVTAQPGSCCTAPFDDIVILWNGDVVLCCYDYNGFNIIGNINQDSIENIWNSEKVMIIRNKFKNKETHDLPLCNKCYLAPHNFKDKKLKSAKRGYNEEKYILNLYPPFRELLHKQQ